MYKDLLIWDLFAVCSCVNLIRKIYMYFVYFCEHQFP